MGAWWRALCYGSTEKVHAKTDDASRSTVLDREVNGPHLITSTCGLSSSPISGMLK